MLGAVRLLVSQRLITSFIYAILAMAFRYAHKVSDEKWQTSRGHRHSQSTLVELEVIEKIYQTLIIKLFWLVLTKQSII